MVFLLVQQELSDRLEGPVINLFGILLAPFLFVMSLMVTIKIQKKRSAFNKAYRIVVQDAEDQGLKPLKKSEYKTIARKYGFR